MSNRSFLTNLKVRFTPPSELNDPRELAPTIHIRNPNEYAGEIVSRNFEAGYIKLLTEHPQMTEQEALERCIAASTQLLEKYKSDDQEIKKMMFDIIMRTTNKNIGVFSLTESNNNELMWAHYANSHAGYVVGFKTDSEFFHRRKNDPKVCGELANVIYSDNAPTLYLDAGGMTIPKELFFTKTTKWSYEREWRMIRMLEAADEVVNSNIHLYQVSPESIHSIIFGDKFPESDKQKIQDDITAIAPNVVFMNAHFNHRGEFIVY